MASKVLLKTGKCQFVKAGVIALIKKMNKNNMTERDLDSEKYLCH